MSGSGSAPLTYADVGVKRGDITASLSALLKGVRYRPPSSSGSMVDLPGHFAAVLKIGREHIAMTTDGVGTKLLLAQSLGRWEEMGQDVVAVNVNDLCAVGARPAAFLDTISCRQPDTAVFAALGRGLDRALRESRCALAGGETAVVPDLVQGLDLSGTAIGFFPKGRKPVTGAQLRSGDVLIGLPSTGFHANGYTLVRRLLETSGVSLAEHITGERLPLGRLLLAPSRIYVGAIEALLGAKLAVGLAHITGGGYRNLIRLHPKFEFHLDAFPQPQGLFQWVEAISELPAYELYQTFNMGYGFVVAVHPKDEEAALDLLAENGEPKARVLGHVRPGHGVRLPDAEVHYNDY